MDAVLDELYATPPAGFVQRRNELADQAKADGRTDDARRIRSARRPTLGAWAANLLVRTQPDECRQFLELGRALREAHRTLDRSQLRELSGQQWRIISGLSRQAAQLAHDAGQRLSDAVQRELESTLRAVLADPAAADEWAAGRLTTSLTPPSGLPSGGTPAAEPRRQSPSSSVRSSTSAHAKDDLAERRRRRQEQLATARKEAKSADRAVRERRKAHAAADDTLQRARDRRDQAQQQVEAFEQQLERARQDLEGAGHEQRRAEEEQRAAAKALDEAERDARTAARRVEQLSSPRSR